MASDEQENGEWRQVASDNVGRHKPVILSKAKNLRSWSVAAEPKNNRSDPSLPCWGAYVKDDVCAARGKSRGPQNRRSALLQNISNLS